MVALVLLGAMHLAALPVEVVLAKYVSTVLHAVVVAAAGAAPAGLADRVVVALAVTGRLTEQTRLHGDLVAAVAAAELMVVVASLG